MSFGGGKASLTCRVEVCSTEVSKGINYNKDKEDVVDYNECMSSSPICKHFNSSNYPQGTECQEELRRQKLFFFFFFFWGESKCCRREKG